MFDPNHEGEAEFATYVTRIIMNACKDGMRNLVKRQRLVPTVGLTAAVMSQIECPTREFGSDVGSDWKTLAVRRVVGYLPEYARQLFEAKLTGQSLNDVPGASRIGKWRVYNSWLTSITPVLHYVHVNDEVEFEKALALFVKRHKLEITDTNG